MSEQRWTAPETGWYRFGGSEPEFLGAEQPEAEPPGGSVHVLAEGELVTEPQP